MGYSAHDPKNDSDQDWHPMQASDPLGAATEFLQRTWPNTSMFPMCSIDVKDEKGGVIHYEVNADSRSSLMLKKS